MGIDFRKMKKIVKQKRSSWRGRFGRGIYIILIITISFFLSCQNSISQIVSYEHPINYQPVTYVCYKTNDSLIIDGKLDELIWQKTPVTNDFVDIQGDLKPLPPYQTNVKMLWDDEYFYFGAFMEEPHIWGKLRKRDTVIYYDNDFEIFLDPDGDTHHYFEFEINALNTVWDLLLLHPYREDNWKKVLNNWDIKGIKSAVFINGTLNNATDLDSFWTVEVAIPWKVLNEMTPPNYLPKEGVQWRVNFSRVNWNMDISNDIYKKQKGKNGKILPEENWVWSPQGYINMHAPETWGFVQFSEIIAGEKTIDFIPLEDEKIKWGLRQLYYQQRRHYRKNKQYADNLNALTLPKVDIENYSFEPQLLKTFNGYEIIAESIDNQTFWLIQEDGKIIRIAKK